MGTLRNRARTQKKVDDYFGKCFVDFMNKAGWDKEKEDFNEETLSVHIPEFRNKWDKFCHRKPWSHFIKTAAVRTIKSVGVDQLLGNRYGCRAKSWDEIAVVFYDRPDATIEETAEFLYLSGATEPFRTEQEATG
jgi:hypothetical protein